ncbi:MAG: GGDEF domain-containing protein [Sulfurimonas sp.]|nr:GGDEF domain-containing protein [Sulfurimonas sp.]
MSRAKRHTSKFALLFLDLDGFKNVNDTVGHDAGDSLLKDLSKSFKAQIREFDTIARYGGDEFVIILSGIENEEEIVPKLSSLIECASKEYRFEEERLSVGVSIGVAIYPEHGENDTQLLSSADSAMYEAKKDGKDCFHFYNDVLNTKLKRIMRIDTLIKHALEKMNLKSTTKG